MKFLLYAEYRQFVNLIRLTLRTPKRLIFVVLFGIYIVSMILGQVAMHGRGGMLHSPPANIFPVDLFQAGLLVFAILVTLVTLYRSFSESLVIYSPAEMDVLIAMPIGRRGVMARKLVGLYVRIAVYIAFIGVFMLPQLTFTYGMQPLIVVALLSMVLYAASVINVATVINLIVACSSEDKRWQKALVLWSILGLLLFMLMTFYSTHQHTGDAFAGVTALIRQPILVWLAAPAVWMSGLATATLRGWNPACGWQLAALAALALGTMAMVLARKENPYEPSLAASARRATIKQAMKSGDMGKVRAEMLRNRKQSAATLVAPFGRGAMAILWKNMLLSVRSSRGAMIGVAILVPAAALTGRVMIKDKGLLEFAPHAMVGVVLYASWVLAMAMSQMLRADLKQVNTLKPMPISPWWLMVAETANTGLLAWAFIWLLFGSAVFLLGVPASNLLMIAGLSLPFVAYAAICSQTAVAVLYPNWQDPSQQWIAQLLGMGLSMLSVAPPAAVGALLFVLRVPPVIAVPVVVAISLALAAAGITLGAAVYRRHDPTDE